MSRALHDTIRAMEQPPAAIPAEAERLLSGLNPQQIMDHLTQRTGIADWAVRTARGALQLATPVQRRMIFSTLLDDDAVSASLAMATDEELWAQIEARHHAAILITEGPAPTVEQGENLQVHSCGTPAQRAGLVQFLNLYFAKQWGRLIQ